MKKWSISYEISFLIFFTQKKNKIKNKPDNHKTIISKWTLLRLFIDYARIFLNIVFNNVNLNDNALQYAVRYRR